MKTSGLILKSATAIFILVAGANSATAAGDAALGEKVFKQCKACHQIGEGAENSVGPVLTGVVGRKTASYPGYSYGKYMRKIAKTDMVWDEEKINEWLKSPKKYLRKLLDTRKAKAKMKFKLKKQKDRDNVIAYLKTFSAEMKTEMKSEAKSEENMATATAPAMMIKPTDICVENRSGKTLLFVVEAKGGERMVETLDSNKILCAPEKMAGKGGTVGVFQDKDALEGCSRLATAGKSERLVAYEPFDNCTWAK